MMQFLLRVAILGSFAATILLGAAPTNAADERVPCVQVVAELNRRISRGMHRDPVRMAKSLDTDVTWVESCLRLSGRQFGGIQTRVDSEEPTPVPFEPNEFGDSLFSED